MRDWIADGGTWDAFCSLVGETAKINGRAEPVDLQALVGDAMDTGTADKAADAGSESEGDTDEDELAGGESTSEESGGLSIISVGQLTIDHVTMRPTIISGLLRVGEVMTAIAPPKRGKSATIAPWSISRCGILLRRCVVARAGRQLGRFRHV